MKKIILIGLIGLSLTSCAALVIPYKQTFTTISNIPEISVILKPAGSTWEANILNNTDKTIKFLVNESSYVTTDGKTERLIRGQTRRMHSDLAQTTIPIPPNARFNDFLVPESGVNLSDFELSFPPAPKNINNPGKFYLVFEISGEKRTWISELQFSKSDESSK